MLRTLAALVVGCLAAALLVVSPAFGAAASVTPAASAAEPFPSIALTGRTQRGRFKGHLAVRRVAARGNQLVASGSVTGQLRDRRYPSTQPVVIRRFRVVLAVSATPGATDCASLTMATPAVRTRLIGLRAEIAATNFVVTPHRNGPPAVRDILCATSQTLTAQPPAPGTAPSPTLVHLLNALRLVHA